MYDNPPLILAFCILSIVFITAFEHIIGGIFKFKHESTYNIKDVFYGILILSILILFIYVCNK